ncbi:hypothetical protein Tco_0690749 [Tanacetum coccineum]
MDKYAFVDVNEYVSESVVEKPTVETNEPKTARKENRAPIIEDWVSESKEEYEPNFNLGPSILQKSILVVEISFGRCGIANLAISQLGKLVEEGGGKDFQENFDDEVDERSSKEYLRDLDIEFHERALSANSKYEEEVSDDKEVTQVKVLMALADDELTVRKNHAHNGEWIDITIRKVNILLSMDEDADWKYYLKYINIDLKFVEEQRLNLLSKYNKIIFELNNYKDELLVLKQAKIDVVTFQIQNTKLTKLNHALQEQRKE